MNSRDILLSPKHFFLLHGLVELGAGLLVVVRGHARDIIGEDGGRAAKWWSAFALCVGSMSILIRNGMFLYFRRLAVT
jgi:hypothetical protein